MITLLHGEEATILCDETDVVTFPYLEGILSQYSYQSLLAYYHVREAIPNTESISVQGVYLTERKEFIPNTIWVLTEGHAGYLPSETANRILREAGFPAAILPASSSGQKTDPAPHRQNPQTIHGVFPQPGPSLQE